MLTIVLLPLLLSSWRADSSAALLPDAIGLLAFKASADLNNVLLYNINEPFDHCEWRGVKCAQGRVVRYDVQGFGLRGGVAAATLSRLDQLRVLNLKNNSLAGPVPDFSGLVNLKTLLLGRNYFSGEFPPSILFLRSLQVLDFSHNNFNGFLPENLTGLSLLESVRLEYNRFSGFIPPLNQTNLRVFIVSHNNLSGQIPLTPTLKKLSIFSFLHNPNLCGEVINVPCRHSDFFNSSSAAATPMPSPPSPLLQITQSSDTPSPDRRKHRVKVGLILGLFTGALLLFAVLVSAFALFRKRGREEEGEETQQIQHKVEERTSDAKASSETTAFFSIQPENSISGVKKNVGNRFAGGNLIFFSLEEEQYTLEQLMKASAELLGRGSIGTTYKAVMANQLAVSLKRLDSSKTAIISEEAFEQHMESIAVLRHPNLVPIRAYFRAKQERLIIYDYQLNGSLFNLIHGSRSTRGKPLHWTSCLKIAEDVAKGLAYIHQASRFIHGNLKSSNVLLGSDFEACLTDYCLTPIIDTSLHNDQDSSNYKAPETRKSARFLTPKSDVYAFGILLLELLSGKHPSQHPFLAPPDMSEWVRAMRDNDGEDDMRLRMLVEVASFCSITSPEQRPTMWQVLKMINNVKEIVGVGSSDP